MLLSEAQHDECREGQAIEQPGCEAEEVDQRVDVTRDDHHQGDERLQNSQHWLLITIATPHTNIVVHMFCSL